MSRPIASGLRAKGWRIPECRMSQDLRIKGRFAKACQSRSQWESGIQETTRSTEVATRPALGTASLGRGLRATGPNSQVHTRFSKHALPRCEREEIANPPGRRPLFLPDELRMARSGA